MTHQKKLVPLHKAPKGYILTVKELPPGRVSAQLIRLGIQTGEMITCVERLPGGTCIVRKHRQEIAIGQELAESIIVAVVRRS